MEPVVILGRFKCDLKLSLSAVRAVACLSPSTSSRAGRFISRTDSAKSDDQRRDIDIGVESSRDSASEWRTRMRSVFVASKNARISRRRRDHLARFDETRERASSLDVNVLQLQLAHDRGQHE